MLLGVGETFTEVRICGKKLDYQGCAIDWDIGSLKPAIHTTAKFCFLEFYCFVRDIKRCPRKKKS